jgi:branched-chain amino acid transport system substrate-binding protein
VLTIFLILITGCSNSDIETNDNMEEKEVKIEENEIDDSVYHIYIDADWSTEKSSNETIEMGINVALSNCDCKLDGEKVKIIRIDHKSNPDINLYNLKNTIMKDEKTIAVYSGLHSPAIFANLDAINENKILTLVPWAAGGG